MEWELCNGFKDAPEVPDEPEAGVTALLGFASALQPSRPGHPGTSLRCSQGCLYRPVTKAAHPNPNERDVPEIRAPG